MELAKLYKKDASGNTRVWWAEVGESPHEGYWRTHSGRLSGTISVTEWKWANPRSQDTAYKQAHFYASAEMEKKLKTGDYQYEEGDIGTQRSSIISPMLAHPYVGWQRPCYAQPKLDGIRCLANKDGLWTRTNRQIVSAPHIEGELKEFFAENPDVVLDGELYNHDLHDNFNKIISLARKTTPDFAELEESAEMIEYWIFDCYIGRYPDTIFKDRLWFLQSILYDLDHNLNMVKATPTKWINTKDELDIHNMELLTDGYEGQIIRHNTPYEQKRTNNLLKRKEFVDQEFELKDILEGQGQWSGYAKIAVCSLPDGREFRAGISGTQYFCAILLEDKAKYKSVTVKYQALTPDGVPRFPIATKFYEEIFGGLDERIKPRRDLFA
jgi:DNA ligase-1